MRIPRPIRKQLRVAAFSSPAISASIVTPMFILGAIRFELYPWAFVLSTVLVFLLWLINIGVWRMADRGGGWVRYACSYFSCILFTFFLFRGLIGHYPGEFGSRHSGLHFHVILFIAVNTVILILQDLAAAREKNARIELENSRLRMRDMEAMNLRLTQQVHPHFLFNSLSTLKALIGVDPEQATEYLVRLSGFLRSSMTDRGLVPVGKELELCADYLTMQRIRFGDALRFSIEVPEDVRVSFSVPVFSLQLLVENAIKHNVLTQDRPLYIEIIARAGAITVSNNLQRKEPVASGGSGLLNLRERYKALGGDAVVIEETADRFFVSIKLLIHERGDH